MLKQVITGIFGSRHDRERKRIQPVVDVMAKVMSSGPFRVGNDRVLQYIFQTAPTKSHEIFCDVVGRCTQMFARLLTQGVLHGAGQHVHRDAGFDRGDVPAAPSGADVEVDPGRDQVARSRAPAARAACARSTS
mgnify:CR=1 FL=1